MKAENKTIIGLAYFIAVLPIFLELSWDIFGSMLKLSLPVLSGMMTLAKLALVIQLLLCIPLVITIMKNIWLQENIVSFYAMSLI